MAYTRRPAMLGLPNTAVCCRECDPPTRVEIPARVFYRLKDHEMVSCPNGHQGSLAEYKQAATGTAERHGPFMALPEHLFLVHPAAREA